MARLHDARLPRMKTLEEFDFNQAPHIPAPKIRELAEGGYIERAEPVVLMGECGTGKTHSGHRAMRGGLPPEAASALHYRRQPGQRTGRSATTERSAPRAGDDGCATT